MRENGNEMRLGWDQENKIRPEIERHDCNLYLYDFVVKFNC